MDLSSLPKINIKEKLVFFLPSIFALLGEQEIDWDSVSEKYEKELYSRIARMEEAKKNGLDSIIFEACLFDIIVEVFKQRKGHEIFLNFINEVIVNITKTATSEEKARLSKTIYNLMINTDKNYLNFVGELAVLNLLLGYGFKLERTEEPLYADFDESARIDFTLSKDGKPLLVEVYNIHLSDSKELSEIEIQRLFSKKINKKRLKKSKGSERVFYISPVLWGDYKTLKRINQYYNDKWNFKDTLYPAAFMSYSHKNGKHVRTVFGPINKLILSEDGGPVSA
jgi:hypothetical protein